MLTMVNRSMIPLLGTPEKQEGYKVKYNISGNEAVARAAIDAGSKLIIGYPGTPSSEVIASIWDKDVPGVTVEWSSNEKVALEQAGAASWAGQRAMVTMKMSGLNVAYDSLISFVYSGGTGGFVVYVCDDPGVAAGMPEQDVRGFAFMSDMPVLEPASVYESYAMTLYAFELSEAIGGPVMLRSVTNVAQSHAIVELPEAPVFTPREPVLIRDIFKYTKAGAKICMDQHRDLLARLDAAEAKLTADKKHDLRLGEKGCPGIISVGVCNSFIDEALEMIQQNGVDISGISILRAAGSNPYPNAEIQAMLAQCSSLLILEENEPYMEKAVLLAAKHVKNDIPIFGKLSGVFSRIGNYTALTCAQGMATLFQANLVFETRDFTEAEGLTAARPIGVCAGCPHRGVYIALNKAVKTMGYKKDEVMITGDIGCTILGMSPPFHTLWTEVAMGASIAMAQGYVHAGVKTPVFATIGDSTFIHAGMPPLVNAVQNDTPITVVIMDNGWTAMTGMQVNANTAPEFQQKDGNKRINVAEIAKGLGVEQLFIVDAYDVSALTDTFVKAAALPGVKVVVARRECAIQAGRRKIRYGVTKVDPDACINCKICINTTGCAALVFDGDQVFVDQQQCNGCGICTHVCPKQAIVKEEC